MKFNIGTVLVICLMTVFTFNSLILITSAQEIFGSPVETPAPEATRTPVVETPTPEATIAPSPEIPPVPEIPGELPGTAVDFLAIAMDFLVAFMVGVIMHWLTDVVNFLPAWITGNEKKVFVDKMAGLVGWLVPMLGGHLVTYLTPLFQFLDDGGYWKIILVAAPVLVSKGLFELRAYRRVKASG